jgi:hypothetical protein
LINTPTLEPLRLHISKNIVLLLYITIQQALPGYHTTSPTNKLIHSFNRNRHPHLFPTTATLFSHNHNHARRVSPNPPASLSQTIPKLNRLL